MVIERIRGVAMIENRRSIRCEWFGGGIVLRNLKIIRGFLKITFQLSEDRAFA
jgi:hypothetical protein